MKYSLSRYNQHWGFAGLLVLALLSGCSLAPYQSAPVSSIELPPSNGPHRTATPGEVRTPVPEQAAPPVAIMPGSSAANSGSGEAVDQLLDEGWVLYNQQRYEASISTAERALRIDRHRSELYQLLSRNYLATLQLQQAEQLARQGLSVGSISDAERSQLEQLLWEIKAAQ